jgi:hypothetical protein
VTKAEATLLKHVSIALCFHPAKVGYGSECVQIYLESRPKSALHFEISDGNRTQSILHVAENKMVNNLFNNYHDNLKTSG